MLNEPSNLADEERGLLEHQSRVTRSTQSSNEGTQVVEETEMRSRANSIMTDTSGFVKRKTSQLFNAIRGGRREVPSLSPKLAAIIEAYTASDIAVGIHAEIDALSNRDPEAELPNVAEEVHLLRGRRGANWLMQFRILSGRAFKNMYRDPALLAAHYLSSIALARECLNLFRD